jgi:hypothetical protein
LPPPPSLPLAAGPIGLERGQAWPPTLYIRGAGRRPPLVQSLAATLLCCHFSLPNIHARGRSLARGTLHHKHHAVVLLIPPTTPPHLTGPRRMSRWCDAPVQLSEAPFVATLGSDREEETLV